jgi:hypothetical protein
MTQHPTPSATLDKTALDFVQAPPVRCVMLIDAEHGLAKTASGVTLGRIALGPVYEVPGFGRTSSRQPVHVWAINGLEYVGTYYRSSGDYARLKVKK